MNQQKPQSDLPKRPRWAWIWWLVLIALIVWNIFAFLPASQPEVTIPYTAFLAQVVGR